MGFYESRASGIRRTRREKRIREQSQLFFLLAVDFVDFNLACGIIPFPSSVIIVAAMEIKIIV